jgi:hypothetical protein
MRLARVLLATVALVATIPPSVSAESAAGTSNRWTIVFDVACDMDGDGSQETSLQVATFVNGTSTGHVLGTTSQANVLAGVATISVGDEVRQVVFPHRAGVGLDGVDCVAVGSYVQPDGVVVHIAIAELVLLITPQA